MNYNPHIHHRRSIRLKGYDYSQAGLYFITICCQDRAHLFGEIENGEMILNDAGKMIAKWYYELENKFNDIKCHEMVVMPNHFHCIVENVGADLRVCPNTNIADGNIGIVDGNNGIVDGNNGIVDGNTLGESESNTLGESESNILGESESNILGESESNILGEHKSNILGEHKSNILGEHKSNILGEHAGSPLHRVVQWFKTMTTNHYIRGVKQNGWKPFDKKIWQRNYYENIIRNENAYQRISQYIINNPQNWDNDSLK